MVILRQHVPKSGADVVAGLSWVFWTFGPLLVLSMNQTRAQKTRKLLPHLLGPRLVHREY